MKTQDYTPQIFSLSVLMAMQLAECMAENERAITIAALSDRLDTSPVVLREIAIKLETAGLVKLSRGNEPKVCLAESPDQITLLDIFNAITQGTPLFAPGHLYRSGYNVANRTFEAAMALFSETEAILKNRLAKATLASVLHAA
jgi:DNA-binding IscR family transcriptional regulator